MNPKIVAFATPDYAEEMLGLKATASELGLRVHDLALPAMTWHEAVCFKPRFIEDRLASLEAEFDGVLYTDADSRFRRVPDWSRWNGIEFSCHLFRRRPGWDAEMLTGTLWFGKGERVIAFVHEWAEATKAYGHTDTPEQHSLRTVWARWRDKLSFLDLGAEHCYIFDDFKAIYPGIVPTIEHFQASRRQRRRE